LKDKEREREMYMEEEMVRREEYRDIYRYVYICCFFLIREKKIKEERIGEGKDEDRLNFSNRQ
jgi:hypothetical protein